MQFLNKSFQVAETNFILHINQIKYTKLTAMIHETDKQQDHSVPNRLYMCPEIIPACNQTDCMCALALRACRTIMHH